FLDATAGVPDLPFYISTAVHGNTRGRKRHRVADVPLSASLPPIVARNHCARVTERGRDDLLVPGVWGGREKVVEPSECHPRNIYTISTNILSTARGIEKIRNRDFGFNTRCVLI